MIVRPYHPGDCGKISSMLLEEDISKENQVFDSVPTWVIDNEGDIIGFFSFLPTKPYPTMRYFCIKRVKNRIFWARIMLKAIKLLMRDSGFKKMEVNADKRYLQKMIEYYFRTPAYRQDDMGFCYYLVEV